MFELCIFDLDETLLHTEDLEDTRLKLANNSDKDLICRLIYQLNSNGDRLIYTQEFIKGLRNEFPDILLAIFTRSPRSYTEAVLDWAYPDIEWDYLVCYEDVNHTKPNGEGIHLAMDKLDIEDLNKVVIVGDSDVDIRAGYNAGCLTILDRSGWPFKHKSNHWRALELVPDGLIDKPDDLKTFLYEHNRYLPYLEASLDSMDTSSKRFDKLGYFIPRQIGGDNTSFPVYIAGRNFANYESLYYKRYDHKLTISIEKNKESTEFPEEWLRTIVEFVKKQCLGVFFRKVTIIITSVPHRPGRVPRLENLLNQVIELLNDEPIDYCNVILVSDLLAYQQGVRSQHGEHLNKEQRFVNVRDHLYVNKKIDFSTIHRVIVIDDVVTTGASLIYSSKYLVDSGARNVVLFAMAKNISDVLK